MEHKIILTGTFGVGKTSLFNKILHDSFQEQYITTIGVKIGKKDLNNQQVALWDIAGEITQDKIPPTYFLNTQQIIYVIDLSRPNTFSSISSDLNYLTNKYSDCALHTIGNKIDLFESENQLQTNLQQLPCECAILTSAKTGKGIPELQDLITTV